MTGRERVTRAIDYDRPDRTPAHENLWEDTLTLWREQGLPADVAPGEYFDFDIVELGVDASPRFDARLLSDDGEFYTMRDRFGYVARKYRGKSRTLEYLSVPVPDRAAWEAVRPMFARRPGEPARCDVEPFPFRLAPVPSWEDAVATVRTLENGGRYILAGAYGPHEAAWRLHGFTPTLMDLALDPGFIADIAGTYAGFLIEVIDACLVRGMRFDGFMLIEDLGHTRGLMFSPGTWRDVYRPAMERIGSFLRERGVVMWMHSCGNVVPLFSDLIECGVRVMNPLEAKAGLDVRELAGLYGDALCWYGNIDVRALARSHEDAEREVRGKVRAFHDGGFIFHSDHSVPPEVSLDRYRFALDCARGQGGAVR